MTAGSYPGEFTIAQASAERGGWYSGPMPTQGEIDAAQRRWADRAFRDDVKDKDGWVPNQCGGCHFFAAFGGDYGVCWNERSPMDGLITFEHGGCLEHSTLRPLVFGPAMRADELPSSTALLAPAVGPDLTSDYWRLKQLPAFTTVINGVRVNYDHLQRVQRARMAVEQCLGAVELQSNNTGAGEG